MIDDFDFDNDFDNDADLDNDLGNDADLHGEDITPQSSDIDNPDPYHPTNPDDVIEPSPYVGGTHNAMSRARSAWGDPFGNPFSQPTNAWEQEGVDTDDEKTGGELRENANRESEPEKSGSDNVHFGNRDQCIAACKMSRTTYESKMKVVYD